MGQNNMLDKSLNPALCWETKEVGSRVEETPSRRYSQHGEDGFLLSLVDDKTTPVFVDIGAYDGITISNSRAFREEKNWRLILVDANKEACSRAGKLYEGDDKVSVLREFITNTKNKYGYLDLDPEKWGLAKVKTYTKKTKVYNKKCITLSELANSLGLTGIDDIGILSIDIEGTELDVLEEFFNKSSVRPQFICVEANTPEADKALKDFLDKEYKLIKKIAVNLIFKRKDI